MITLYQIIDNKPVLVKYVCTYCKLTSTDKNAICNETQYCDKGEARLKAKSKYNKINKENRTKD